MLISRWQAPSLPNISQMKMMFEAEGLQPFEEVYPAEAFVPDHRHPFDEVRMVAEGEMVLDISGNKLLLRPGDRIVIPSNTRHSKKVQGTGPCLCICAQKTF